EMSGPQLIARRGLVPPRYFEASQQFLDHPLRGDRPTRRTFAPTHTIFVSLLLGVHKANHQVNLTSRLHMVSFEYLAYVELDHTLHRYQVVVVPSVSKEIVRCVA